MGETDAQTVAQPAAPARQGEPCEECAALLASDQRYCLNCGRRRGGPRVDYRHCMAAAAGSAEAQASEPAQAPAAEPPPRPQRDYAPLAAVGGIAVLGLMLLVGVLIGRGNSNTTTSAPPVVVRAPGSAAESSTANTGASSKASGGESASAKKAKHGHGGGTANTGSAVHAGSNKLEELNSQSGGSYEEQSKKLPNEIATPGKPPPIDKSKPPGGGEGGAEVIK